MKTNKHNKPPTFGQRSLWLAYEKIPFFLLSISGIPKPVNIQNTKKQCQITKNGKKFQKKKKIKKRKRKQKLKNKNNNKNKMCTIFSICSV